MVSCKSWFQVNNEALNYTSGFFFDGAATIALTQDARQWYGFAGYLSACRSVYE